MVVPAAVAVLVKPARKLSDDTLALESRSATVEAVAAVATPVPVVAPLMTGVVSVGLVNVLLVRI